MKPIEFPEQTKVLAKPPGMTDEQCSSLPVFTDGIQCISCWQGGLRERLAFLFTGRMWLSVMSAHTQPPVWVSPFYPFVKPNPQPQMDCPRSGDPD